MSIHSFKCKDTQALFFGRSVARLARETGLPSSRIADIVAGKSPITADTDLRLCRYFGMSDGWWLRGQVSYDSAIARGTAPDISVRPRSA